MSVEFSFPTLAYGIEILLFLLVCGVQELRVDCDRVSSLILNLRQPVANSGSLNVRSQVTGKPANYRAGSLFVRIGISYSTFDVRREHHSGF